MLLRGQEKSLEYCKKSTQKILLSDASVLFELILGPFFISGPLVESFLKIQRIRFQGNQEQNCNNKLFVVRSQQSYGFKRVAEGQKNQMGLPGKMIKNHTPKGCLAALSVSTFSI
jgi:hypothetical protein